MKTPSLNEEQLINLLDCYDPKAPPERHRKIMEKLDTTTAIAPNGAKLLHLHKVKKPDNVEALLAYASSKLNSKLTCA